jgi:hypothetical protein
MDSQARYLVFHSAVVLLAGLLVGVPYARAVRRSASDETLRAWRLAHSTLTVGPALTLAIAALLSSLSVGTPIKSWIAWAWIASNYGFCFSLPAAAMAGHRGMTLNKPLMNQLIFAGNMIGIGASSIGAVIFLYAAYVSLD